jgi:Protein of unknown function (DUF3618)
MAQATTDPQDQSVAELERQVNEERANVSNTVDALMSKASVGNVVEEIARVIGENGGTMSRNLGRTLRDNPLPALLTGVGLAWLMAGGGGPRLQRSSRSDRDDDYDNYENFADYDDEELYAYRDSSDVPMAPMPYDTSSTRGTTYVGGELAEDNAQLGTGSETPPKPGMGERISGAAGHVRSGASSAVEGARHRAAAASESAGHAMEGARSMLRGAGEAARSRAGRARRSTMHAGQQGRDTLESLMQDQPLVFGALALAVGAAIGGALPRSETEDRLFGDQSVKIKDSARRMATSEAHKAEAVASAVAREATQMLDETAADADARTPSGAEAVDRAEAGVRRAAERLTEAGRAEAERQNLGGTASGSDAGTTKT